MRLHHLRGRIALINAPLAVLDTFRNWTAGSVAGRGFDIAGILAVATACGLAAAGPIAFVALAAPRLARRLSASPDVPVVSGAMMGMALLLAADLASQHLPLGIHMPIGLTTGLLGGFYLLWLLVRSRSV